MMKKTHLRLLTVLTVSGGLVAGAVRLLDAQGPNPRPQTWVDCELFDGVVTRTHFDPRTENFDELYMGGNGFKDGVPLISESKPGDTDYNGGRWHVNRLLPDVDPSKYATVCRVEELDVGDFQSTNTYFECPLLPRRGMHR